MPPQIAVLAGPNGAGKSTLAASLIYGQLGIVDYVNADVIAQGLSAFDPERRALDAGRVMLEHMRRLASEGTDFAFETTLASRTFAPWIDSLAAAGYEFNLFFVWLPDAETAIRRVASRVAHGGHHVADEVVRRRHERGRSNFFELYQPRADRWQVYNGVGASDGPRLVAEGSRGATTRVHSQPFWELFQQGP